MIKFSSTRKEFKQATMAIKFVQSAMPKAFSAAMNRVSQGVRTEAVKKVRELYYVKAGDVRETIRITKASAARLEMIFTSRGPSIPLIKFKTTPTKVPKKPPRVLRASVKKIGGKKPIPGAFVAQMRSGHLGVFERASKKRTPINQLFGPAIPVMLSEPGIAEHLQSEAERRMAARLDHEVGRVLGRMKG